MPTPLLILATAAAVAPALSFDAVATAARPGAAELRAASELAAVESVLAATRGGLREPATLGFAAGARSGGGDTSLDLGADLELPLLAARGDRDALAALAGEARRVLVPAARAETLLDLRLAYAGAWEAERRQELRREDLEVVERWLAAARARAGAGADPPYEAELVALEAAQARWALAEAGAERAAAWAALGALAELPAEPAPLADPPWAGEAAADGERFRAGALRRAAAVRAALDAAAAALEAARQRARWALVPGVEREGDEEVARLGVALRLPRPGEVEAARMAVEAAAAAGRREAEVAAGRLAARFEAARALATGLREAGGEPSPAAPLAAIERRLAEGASRVTEALLVRRQVLAAREAALARRAAAARAAAELIALTEEVTP